MLSASANHTPGFDSLPPGGVLLVPNRISLNDLQQMGRLFGSRLVCLYDPQSVLPSGLNDYLEQERHPTLKFEGLPGQSEGIRRAVQASLADNQVVLFIPPDGATQSAALMTYPGALLASVLALGRPVVPVNVHHTSSISLSIDSKHHHPPIISFGTSLSMDKTTPAEVLESWMTADEAAFSSHPELNSHLGYMLLKGMKSFGNTAKIFDGATGTEMSFAKILGAAIAMSRHIVKLTKKKRVGIVLPPGIAATISNVAVILAGKIPVNINFTADREAQRSAIRQADVDRFLTVDHMMRKLQNFPWPAQKSVIFVERILPSLKASAAIWLGLAKILPVSVLATLLGVPKHGGDEEAMLLFTSGSSGEPKGVGLSHRNILGNVTQFASRIHLKSGEDRVLGCLPLFHSFGSTVTLFYPLMEGVSIVAYPNPIEVSKLAELVEKHSVTMMVTTPTFLRGYLKRVKREQLTSLRLLITGAEKLPLSLAQEFEKRFGKRVLEGYGLTETSPVTNVNLPDPTPTDGRVLVPCYRLGSVGQLMPGLAIRITDPNNGQPWPIDRSGMIWFKGTNVFKGYLGNPGKTAEVFDGAWFRTADIGRVDGDGFLYIEGRLSRFSKIGGEMVPHEAVEDHIVKALNLEGESERKVVVTSIPDPDKGEALVLLSTIAGESLVQELGSLRYSLLERGVPALWIPKKLIKVEHIPVLASGKLDLTSCQRIALQG